MNVSQKLPDTRVRPVRCVPSVRFSYSGSVKAPEMQQVLRQPSTQILWKQHQYLKKSKTLWEVSHWELVPYKLTHKIW